jgi:cytochrome c oxidase assembly protein subunit 15
VVGVAVASLVVNVLIVVTGGAVRLTGSGLGCPTWPPCSSGHFVATREQGIHGLVENSNRALTTVLLVVALATLAVTWRARPRRPGLFGFALALLVGIAAQAVLGGVTVLTGLNPGTVMAHFLVSMLLIALATVFVERSREGDAPPVEVVRHELVLGGRLVVAVTAALLVAGTVVTGSGPHSGDADATNRFPFELSTVAQLHADLVFLLLGLVATLLLALRAVDAPAGPTRRVLDLLVVALAQGAIGYIQYFTKLPVVLVGVHVLGACLVWVAAIRVQLGMRVREDGRRDLSATG